MSTDEIRPQPPKRIATPRLLLCRAEDGDGAAIYDAYVETRELLLPWLPWAAGVTGVEALEAYAQRAGRRFDAREDLAYLIWDPHRTECWGGTGLHAIDWSVPSFEIGYWLRRSRQGHGYTGEIVQWLARTAFDELGAERVHIRCDSRNTRSAAVPRRLGFVEEGLLRSDCRGTDGTLRDTCVFGMIRAEFDVRRGEWFGA